MSATVLGAGDVIGKGMGMPARRSSRFREDRHKKKATVLALLY